jgi:hypothetical protein
LGSCARRIEEAVGCKPTDLDEDNVLHIRRVIYNGRVEELAEEQVLPSGIDEVEGDHHFCVLRPMFLQSRITLRLALGTSPRDLS